MSLTGPCWAWAERPELFYLDNCGSRGREATLLEAARAVAERSWLTEVWLGPIDRLVTVSDDQIDVSETWRPRRYTAEDVEALLAKACAETN